MRNVCLALIDIVLSKANTVTEALNLLIYALHQLTVVNSLYTSIHSE